MEPFAPRSADSTDDADAMGDEAIWKDGAVVGWVTSGGYCHFHDCSYATGYVSQTALEKRDENTLWEIEILGTRYKASLLSEPLYDPHGLKMKQ